MSRARGRSGWRVIGRLRMKGDLVGRATADGRVRSRTGGEEGARERPGHYMRSPLQQVEDRLSDLRPFSTESVLRTQSTSSGSAKMAEQAKLRRDDISQTRTTTPFRLFQAHAGRGPGVSNTKSPSRETEGVPAGKGRSGGVSLALYTPYTILR